MRDNSPTILLDLDDTLYDSRPVMRRILQEHTGKCVPFDKWGYSFEPTYGISSDEWADIFLEYRFLESVRPKNEAPEALQRLRDSGAWIVLATYRGWHPEGLEITTESLKRFGFAYDELHVLNFDTPKSQCLSTRAHAFVDDSESNCTELVLSEMSENVYLFDTPWNRECLKFPRIHCPSELIDIL